MSRRKPYGWIRRCAATALLGACIATVGCRVLRPRDEADETARVVMARFSASPSQLSLEGIQEYPGERLFDYMNGAATTFLDHGFQTMVSCDAIRGSTQAKIELYEMITLAAARAVYAELCAGEGDVLAAGEEGCFWAGFEPQGIFRRGRLVAQIYAYAEEAEQGKGMVLEVAALLDGAMHPIVP